MRSMIDIWASQVAHDAVDDYLKSDRFRSQITKHVGWAMQGFEPGYCLADRERFTRTCADRIHEMAREPVYLFGFQLWRKRMPMAFCEETAERIVTDFLKDEKIKFGDPRFDWRDAIELADEDMSYWEPHP